MEFKDSRKGGEGRPKDDKKHQKGAQREAKGARGAKGSEKEVKGRPKGVQG